MNPNIKQSLEIQTKFEFYFLALVFTLLALSIQTAQFTSVYYQFIFELAGWFSLLLSGLAGLSRMEWTPVIHRYMGTKSEKEKILEDLNAAKNFPAINEIGKPLTQDDVEQYIKNIETQISKVSETFDKLEKWNGKTYIIHKWAFVTGIILMLISRGLFHYSELATK